MRASETSKGPRVPSSNSFVWMELDTIRQEPFAFPPLSTKSRTNHVRLLIYSNSYQRHWENRLEDTVLHLSGMLPIHLLYQLSKLCASVELIKAWSEQMYGRYS
jgi:hypothetical protein